MRSTGSVLYTCGGKKAVNTPRDVVHIFDKREYRVLRVNPHSGTVVLRSVDNNANQRSFMRHSIAVCLLPAPTREAEVSVDEPTGNCLCENPTLPVLPDASTP